MLGSGGRCSQWSPVGRSATAVDALGQSVPRRR